MIYNKDISCLLIYNSIDNLDFMYLAMYPFNSFHFKFDQPTTTCAFVGNALY